MHDACKSGQIHVIRRMLDAGVSVEACDASRKTPLHTAILNRQREVVELLLDRGANIEAVYMNMTPLHEAIWAIGEDIAGLLLDRGASAHVVSGKEGITALHLAAFSGLRVIMDRLFDLGFTVDDHDNIGSTPLLWAAMNGKRGTLEYLLGRGAAINAQNKEGWTALHDACARGKIDSAQFLLRRGADPLIKARNGKNAFDAFGDKINPKSTEEQRLAGVALLETSHKEFLYSTIAALKSRVAALERPVLANASLLFSDDISDVEVVCGDGERIPAHRCILAACSQPLRASLLGPWVESAKREITIDQSGAAVRALLQFMYTGEAEAAALDANLQEVLELAALYEQADLKAACEERGLAWCPCWWRRICTTWASSSRPAST